MIFNNYASGGGFQPNGKKVQAIANGNIIKGNFTNTNGKNPVVLGTNISYGYYYNIIRVDSEKSLVVGTVNIGGNYKIQFTLLNNNFEVITSTLAGWTFGDGAQGPTTMPVLYKYKDNKVFCALSGSYSSSKGYTVYLYDIEISGNTLNVSAPTTYSSQSSVASYLVKENILYLICAKRTSSSGYFGTIQIARIDVSGNTYSVIDASFVETRFQINTRNDGAQYCKGITNCQFINYPYFVCMGTYNTNDAAMIGISGYYPLICKLNIDGTIEKIWQSSNTNETRIIREYDSQTRRLIETPTSFQSGDFIFETFSDDTYTTATITTVSIAPIRQLMQVGNTTPDIRYYHNGDLYIGRSGTDYIYVAKIDIRNNKMWGITHIARNGATVNQGYYNEDFGFCSHSGNLVEMYPLDIFVSNYSDSINGVASENRSAGEITNIIMPEYTAWT